MIDMNTGRFTGVTRFAHLKYHYRWRQSDWLLCLFEKVALSPMSFLNKICAMICKLLPDEGFYLDRKPSKIN